MKWLTLRNNHEYFIRKYLLHVSTLNISWRNVASCTSLILRNNLLLTPILNILTYFVHKFSIFHEKWHTLPIFNNLNTSYGNNRLCISFKYITRKYFTHHFSILKKSNFFIFPLIFISITNKKKRKNLNCFTLILHQVSHNLNNSWSNWYIACISRKYFMK